MVKNWRQFLITVLLSCSLILGFNSQVTAEVNPSNLVYQAQQQYHQGRAGAAIPLLQQAQAIYQQRQQLLSQAQVLALISLAQQQQQNWSLARRYLAQSLTLIEGVAPSKSKTQVLAQISNVQGHYQSATGQHKQALLDWQDAEKLYRQLEDTQGITGSILAQAEALRKMGFNRRACNRIVAAFESPEFRCLKLTDSQVSSLITRTESGRQEWQIAGLNLMGSSLLSMGRLERAEQFITASYRVESSLPKVSPSNQAKLWLSMGNINRVLAFQAKERQNEAGFEGRRQAAIAYYQRIGQLKANPLLESYQLYAQLNQLSLLIVTEDWSEAKDLVAQIELPPTPANPYSPVKFARSIQRLKQHHISVTYSWNDLVTFYRQAIAQGQLSGNQRLESYGWGYLGQLAQEQHLNLKETPEALLHQALILAQAEHAPEIAYLWQWRLGQIYRQQQRKTKAIASYQGALTNLNNLRTDLALLSRTVKFNFEDQIEPVYREFADLLLGESADDAQLELAANVIEALQVAELDNYFQDACTTFETRNIAEIDPQAAVIYTVVLPERLEVLLVASDRQATTQPVLHRHSQNITQAKLESTIEQLRRYLAEPDRQLDSQRLAAQVYDWLIRPLTPELNRLQPQTLVFVLDGMLQTIPMAALFDGQHYLLENYALAITPGLRLVNPEENTQPPSFLGGGVSKLIKVDEREFSALTKVPDELNSVSNREGQVLLDEQFTPSNLLEQLNRTSATRIHLATHGQFRPNPQQTFLLMWQKLLNIDEFTILLQSRTKKLTDPIDLLILSACDTAIGDRHGALGLAGIAVRSGALSTLATLWQVNDESTAQLMQHFYAELPGKSKAEALRQAQLKLWQTRDKDWQVPAFWSAYVMIGDWQ